MEKFDTSNVNEYYEEGLETKVPIDIVAFKQYAKESLNNIVNLKVSPFNQLLNENISLKTRQAGALSSKNSPRFIGNIVNNKVHYKD